jgi:7-keto-8-aminopelargonate synthetase-like enzyme
LRLRHDKILMMIEPEPLQQLDRTYVRLRKRKLSYFAGCDYYRLASHPSVLTAVRAGLKSFGLNVAASRLTSGNHHLYQELEEALCDFFDAESALLTGDGYITNSIVCQALAGHFSHALIDARSHPSLHDAARFLDCPIIRFKYLDVSDLKRAIQRCGPGAKLLVMTDGMFSHDGAVSPLDEYDRALPRDGKILVDDAHGAGVLGKTGKGALEETGVTRQRIIQTITLSKAFGAYGGAILCSDALRQGILDRSKLFIGHTPPPLPLANAALRSIKILKSERRLLAQLHRNSEFVKTALADTSYAVPATPGPIVPILPATPAGMKRLEDALLKAAIYPSLISYPNGVGAPYFRFVISSEHSAEQLENLVEVLRAQAAESR